MINVQSQQKNKKIPELRFPEFSGEWDEKKLYGYLRENKTRNINNKYTEVFSVAKEKGVINQIEHLGRSYCAENLTNYKVIFPDDIVYTKSPTASFPFGIIKQNRTERTGVASTLYAVYRPKNKNIGYLIHEYFLSGVNTYNYLVPVVQKGAKNTINIGNSEFLNGSILYLPSIEKEQQKIVSFLKTVDEWINIVKKQKKVVEKYKKGVMQKIFSQEICFKDESGKKFSNWTHGILGNFIDEYDKKTELNNQYPILSSSMGGISLQSDYFNHEVASKNNVGYKIIPRGYFTYRSMSDTGDFTFNIQNIIDVGVVSPAYPVFKAKQNINNIYLYYYLNYSKNIKQSLLFMKQGGTRYALSFKRFAALKISLPHQIEQQKIADFLISLDKAIEAKKQQITLAENWKKGLMQRLFL